MSFLTILLVSSTFYVVHCRPNPTTTTVSPGDSNNSDPQTVLENESTSLFNAEEYQYQADGLLEDMVRAMDKHMIPLMSQLDENTQDELITMALNGFSSYLNYVILLIQEKENHKNEVSHVPDHPFDKDDIIVEFDELEPLFDSGLITAAPISEEDKESINKSSVELQTKEVPETTFPSPVPDIEAEDANEDKTNFGRIAEDEYN